jgi:hypothetical protein
MIATVQQHTPAPSVQKYGQVILQKGFDQVPHSVQNYIGQLDISQSAKLLLLALLSYLRSYDQEVFPAARTLASKIGRSIRQVFYLLGELKTQGLIAIYERVRADGGRDTNGYSLMPLFEKVAAQEDPQIADELAQVEAEAGQPFQPEDMIDEAAIALEEEYGQAEPRTERETARRIRSRWEKMSACGHTWEAFSDLVIEAGQITEARKEAPTRSKGRFTRLVPFFFSSLDRLIAAAKKPEPTRAAASIAPTTRTQSARTEHGRRKASAAIAQKINDISESFHDSSAKASVQQAANIMAANHMDEQTMLDLIQQAREAAQQHQIKRRNGRNFNRMPYFFQVLRDKIAQLSAN